MSFDPIAWRDELMKRLPSQEEIEESLAKTDYDGEITDMGRAVRINTVGPAKLRQSVRVAELRRRGLR